MMTCRAALLNKLKQKGSMVLLHSPTLSLYEGGGGCCQDGLTEGRKMSSKKISYLIS